MAFTSVVLLMVKADALFGIGTAVLIGPVFQDFSWVIIMIPIWLLVVIIPAVVLLIKVIISCMC